MWCHYYCVPDDGRTGPSGQERPAGGYGFGRGYDPLPDEDQVAVFGAGRTEQPAPAGPELLECSGLERVARPGNHLRTASAGFQATAEPGANAEHAHLRERAVRLLDSGP